MAPSLNIVKTTAKLYCQPKWPGWLGRWGGRCCCYYPSFRSSGRYPSPGQGRVSECWRLLVIAQSRGDRWTALRDAGAAPAGIIRLVSSFCISGSHAPHRPRCAAREMMPELASVVCGLVPRSDEAPLSTRRPSKCLFLIFINKTRVMVRNNQVQKVCI